MSNYAILVTIICLSLEPCGMCYPPYDTINETKDSLDWYTTLMNSIGILSKFKWVEQVLLALDMVDHLAYLMLAKYAEATQNLQHLVNIV